MKSRLLYLDLTTPRPYDDETLANEPLGGSEATLVRVTKGLQARGYAVTVAQHNREESSGRFVSFAAAEALRFDVVICFRTTQLIPYAFEKWRDARRILWCEDFSQEEIAASWPVIRGKVHRILGCSRTHKQYIIDALVRETKGNLSGTTCGFIYNCVDDALAPDATPVQPGKFVFFSSPHKGLERTLQVFERARAMNPGLTLYVANPGYLPDMQGLPDGVINLGPLSHAEVIKHVRSSQLVFNLNHVFPETFGIVFAEASAVGAPTLTAPVGAAAEILGDRRMTVDVRDTEATLRRMEGLLANRGTITVNPEFRLTNVLNAWEQELNG